MKHDGLDQDGFREAMRVPASIQGDDELCCPVCHRPYVLHGINCPALSEPVPLSPPEQALADANPSTYPEILPPGQPVWPPRVGPGDHNFRPEPEDCPTIHGCAERLLQESRHVLSEPERRDERAERFSRRYTKDDGSEK